jgi:acetylglutamate kinase
MRLVVKLAGALLDDAACVDSISAQVVQLARQGHQLLVIHGGGKAFTRTLSRMGIESRFVNGLRVTNAETRDVALMVFAGLLNKRLAAAITRAGRPAVGIAASDAHCFRAAPFQHNEIAGGLGYVGYITGVNVPFLESLWAAGVIPVASCLGQDDRGEIYNVNADSMAAACAELIRAERLIYLTDVAGVLDGRRVVRSLQGPAIEQMILRHKVSGGMILKLEAAKRALSGGVREVRIIGGSVPRGLLAAANGMRFRGTRVTPMFPASEPPPDLSSRARRGMCI